MPSSLRRHAVAGLLILAAAAAGFGLRAQDRPDRGVPGSPPVSAAAWQVETAYQPGFAGMAYRQWLMRDPDGAEALLFVGATDRLQTLLRWSGELGFQGEGYLVTGRGERALRTDGGLTVTVSEVRVQRLSDRRLLAYAVVRPDGVVPGGTAAPLAPAWSALLGRSGPYYLVRVAVPVAGSAGADAGAAATAGRLLAAAVPPLLSRARAGV
jgi:Protein of unknown function (DUF3485)